MHESLLQLISQSVVLSETDKTLLLNHFEPVQLAKTTVLETAGRVPAFLYFVVSGFVRLHHVNEQGNDVTTHINCPPGFITSYLHFSNQSCSDENVSSIGAAQLLRLSKPSLDTLLNESQAFRAFSYTVFSESIAYNEKRNKELATLTAQQRYAKLLRENPEIIQQVPVQYIASFLGIHPESLSRIRRSVIS